MPDDITISIDGVEIKTQPGKMVLEAAIDAGVYVPYLCYHSGMKPYAACRMCVVVAENERGRVPGFPAACTLAATDGMTVWSETPDVIELRRSVMQMLIAEHPNGCLTCHRVDICGPSDVCLRHVSVNDRCITCPKNERCEFKDTVRYLGMELESPMSYVYRDIPLEVSDPFYDRDYNLCITCGRCVRACEEMRGDNAICFTERSGKALVGTSFGTSLLESGCEFCGACIDVCPVGALTEREGKWEKPARVERTICTHCPVGCQMNLEINDQGRVIRTVPEFNSPANRGQACYKGKFGMGHLTSGQRLRRPMIRRNGRLENATWDEALDLVAERLRPHRTGAGFGLITAPDSTNEELYLAQKFARIGMNTNNVDHSGNTQPALTGALEDVLGYPGATNSIWDLEKAGCILVFNTNLTESHNVVGVPIKRAAGNGIPLIVIDTREVELTRYADLWLRPAPGTELLLLGAILKQVLQENLIDAEWLAEHADSYDTLVYELERLTDEDIAATAVPHEDIARAARMYGGADAGAIVYGLDNLSADISRECVVALADLALLTRNVDRPAGGIFPMRQGANGQGAIDVGCLPDRLPGGAPTFDDAHRAQVEETWGARLPASAGMSAASMLQSAGGAITSMLLVGDSPNYSNGLLVSDLAVLEQLEFLAVVDTFLSPVAQVADVVLPRATFAEKDGTFTNLERRVQRVRPAITVRNNDAMPEGWIFAELASRLDVAGLNYDEPAQVMDEIASVAPNYRGISYQRLAQETALIMQTGMESPRPTQLLYTTREERGIQWPCPTPDSPSSPVLYANGFPNGRAEPGAPRFRAVPAPTEADLPAILAPGRVLLQSEREITVESGELNRIVRDEHVHVNPADAASWGISDDASVAVVTAANRTTGIARLDSTVPSGVVSITTLFGQLAVELQASEDINPMARVPGLHLEPCRVELAG